MRWLLVVSFVLLALSTSCSRYKEAKEFQDYAGHYLQAQRDYCSTNLLVAEKALLDFRQWISDRDRAGKPRFNFYLNMVQVNARLCCVYETLGEASKAEDAYQLAARAYAAYLRSEHLPEQSLSRRQMLDRLEQQEERLYVGWKDQIKKSPKEKGS